MWYLTFILSSGAGLQPVKVDKWEDVIPTGASALGEKVSAPDYPEVFIVDYTIRTK